MSIILPDGILGAPGLAHVREWILQNTQVLASIDLHPDTFQPKNSTQTSLLVLRRKSEEEIEKERTAGAKADYEVFMALANHIGHDKRGNILYKRDADGNQVVVIEKENPVKIIDDDTQEIAQLFRESFERHRR